MNCRFRNPTNTKAIGKQGYVRVERSRSKLKLNALTVGEHGRANWSPYMNLYTPPRMGFARIEAILDMTTMLPSRRSAISKMNS
jgi:hypothetical protein